MLFCVHSYFFTRESTTFHLKFYPQAAFPGTTGEGLTDVDPVILPNAITAEDFETFLWVFYNPCVLLVVSCVPNLKAVQEIFRL